MTWSVIGIIAGLMTGIAGLPLSILIYLVRGYRNEIREEVTRLDARVTAMEKEKVGKQDWLRETLSTRAKVDKIGETVARIDSRMEAEFGMAAAVNRVADVMERRMESDK